MNAIGHMGDLFDQYWSIRGDFGEFGGILVGWREEHGLLRRPYGACAWAVGDPQDLRPGLSSVAPTGLLDRGFGWIWSALRWVAFAGWFGDGRDSSRRSE